MPKQVVRESREAKLAKLLRGHFASHYLRRHHSDEVLGVQLGKNRSSAAPAYFYCVHATKLTLQYSPEY